MGGPPRARWLRALALILATSGPLAPGAPARAEDPRAEDLRARLAEAREAGAPAIERAALRHDLGGLLVGQERFDEAARAFERARALYAEEAPDSPELARILAGLAVARTGQERFEQAEELFRESLEIQRRVHGEVHEEVGRAFANLAGFYMQVGRLEDAERAIARALEVHEKAGSSPGARAVALRNRAELLDQKGEEEKATALHRRIVELYREADPPRPGSLAAAQARLGQRLRDAGRAGEAETRYRAALEALGSLPAASPALLVRSLDGLAWAMARGDRGGEAERYWGRALAVGERFLGRDAPELAPVLEAYARWLREAGREDEAGALERRAARLRAGAEASVVQ